VAFSYFSIPVRDSGAAQAELNAFLASHKVLSVDQRWVEAGANSFWAVSVDYLERGAVYAAAGRIPGRNKIDYKEVLKPEEFVVFARLRDLRKEMAQAEGVPVYTIFTNEQLADIVRAKVTTKAQLDKIEGLGEARVGKYGARLLAVLTEGCPESLSS